LSRAVAIVLERMSSGSAVAVVLSDRKRQA
jgi:hypothetical protein